MCCRLLTSYVCNRLLEKKNRPNKDPIWAKGLYYRPRSLNKDPSCYKLSHCRSMKTKV